MRKQASNASRCNTDKYLPYPIIFLVNIHPLSILAAQDPVEKGLTCAFSIFEEKGNSSRRVLNCFSNYLKDCSFIVVDFLCYALILLVFIIAIKVSNIYCPWKSFIIYHIVNNRWQHKVSKLYVYEL